MVTCTQCSSQNLPGMAYCENCGAPLPQDTVVAASPAAPSTSNAGVPAAGSAPVIDPLAAALPQPVMPVDQVPMGSVLGSSPPAEAGMGTSSGANAIAADPGHAPAVPGSATLTVTFPSGQTFVMQGDRADVGRADVAQNWHPALDVIPFGGGAPDLGVSRHHALIARHDDAFVVTDLGSTNGTYVNGAVAPYNQEIALHHGDTLSFGALNTQVAIS